MNVLVLLRRIENTKLNIKRFIRQGFWPFLRVVAFTRKCHRGLDQALVLAAEIVS